MTDREKKKEEDGNAKIRISRERKELFSFIVFEELPFGEK